MLTQKQIDQFWENGFLLSGKIFDDDQIEVLRNELDRVIENYGNTDVKQPVRLVNLSGKADAIVWQIVNIWEASEPFFDLAKNPRIVEEAAQLMNATELRVWHDQIQYKPSGIGGVNMWHQDSPYWPILTPKTTQVTAWIALDDADKSNGCMSMINGTHKFGDQIPFVHTFPSYDQVPEKFEDHPLKITLCPVPKGHVHYHHGLTWHGSHSNKSDRKRRAIAVHYMTQDTLYNSNGNHVMKPFVENVDHGEKLTGDSFPLVWKC